MIAFKSLILIFVTLLLLPHISAIGPLATQILEKKNKRRLLKNKNESVVKEKKKFDLFGFGSHVGAVVSSSLEVVEDFEAVGHGHGIVLLCGSKLCREVNGIREAIEEEAENVEGTRASRSVLFLPFVPFIWFFHMLSTKFASTLLTIGALYAAGLEVMEDAAPGGHHGSLLLAINELIELSIGSHLIPKGWLLNALENHVLRLFLVSSAAIFALVESFLSVAEDMKIGAHHGVVLLAVNNLFCVLGQLREEIKLKEE